jgi:hypothetical protein
MVHPTDMRLSAPRISCLIRVSEFATSTTNVRWAFPYSDPSSTNHLSMTVFFTMHKRPFAVESLKPSGSAIKVKISRPTM